MLGLLLLTSVLHQTVDPGHWAPLASPQEWNYCAATAMTTSCLQEEACFGVLTSPHMLGMLSGLRSHWRGVWPALHRDTSRVRQSLPASLEQGLLAQHRTGL